MANLYFPFSWYTSDGGKAPMKKILAATKKIEKQIGGECTDYDVEKNLDFHQGGILISNRKDLTQDQAEAIWAYAEFYDDVEEEDLKDHEETLEKLGIDIKEIIFEK